MGVNVSTEDFATLEGFVNKSNDERAEILRNAGWEPEGQDNDIATFIGTDIVSAALIRSVMTVCLDKKEANMKDFYKADAEKLQQHFTATLQEYYKELETTKYQLTVANEKLLKQDKELSVYYSSITAETHVANMEIGKTDRAEYGHLQPYNNPPTGILIETEEQIWNNFVKDEESNSKSEGKKRCHVPSDGYDKKDNDAMVGVQASKPTESIHAYNFSNTRQRYHAKISTSICKKSKEEIEQELQKIFNKERFQMEVLFKNGNQYLYVIFTSEQERLRLTNCIEIQHSVGKFYANSERDCTHKRPIELCVDYIPAQATELDIKNVLEGELGHLREITFWPIRGNNQFKKAKIMLEVTCSDKHLIETWSLPMGDNNRIKITPTKLSHEDRNTRTRYGAKVMGLEKEIGIKEVHSLLTESNAKEWFFNTHHEQNQSRERYNSGNRANQFSGRHQDGNHNRGSSPSNGYKNVNRHVRQSGYRGYNQQQQRQNTGGQYRNNGNGFRQGNNYTNSHNYGETVTTMDTNDINNNITRIEDQIILDNQITMEIIKELDTTTMTIPTLMIDTNNNTDHTDLVWIEEEITQTQPTEAITQEKIMAGIPAMDVDTNSTLSIELGGGGNVKTGTKGDVESYEGEETLADNSQEINIDLQNYIQENNKNKEKVNNKIKINNLLKIGVLNIRGLNDENNKKNKKENLKNYIVQEGWDITGINETKLNSNKGKYIYRDWKDIKIRNNSVDDIHSLGSQLLICKRWIDIRTINYKEFTGYAQSIDIVLKGKDNSIRLINVYLICNDKKKKTAITETVDKWINEAQILNLNLIVMGDFNERKVNQDNASKDTMFLDMLEEYNLIDIHTKFNNEEALATWSNSTISTTIDFIYMSYKLINKVEIHEILNIEKVLDTDHKALTITLKIKDEWTADFRKSQETQNFMSKKFLKMEWENIANRVEENLIESPINLDIYNDNTKYWSVLRDRITMEMDKSIKEKQLQLNSKEKYQTDLSKMTIIQHLKKKIAIIGEIENTITKWRKLKGKIENDTLTYGFHNIALTSYYA
ncbi:unnamed protein product [Rhizophagus irregularis]|nr:unnamed protein product [Rhizophagus irregularis]